MQYEYTLYVKGKIFNVKAGGTYIKHNALKGHFCLENNPKSI
jgi:hypothetical protein